jgi:hypothetical protein
MVLTSRISGRRGMLAPLALLAFLAAAARAETGAPPAPAGEAANGRFTMTPVADGFLRLDTRTGQVSLCTLVAGQAQCRAGADERAALEAEIDRLSKENAALKGQKPDAAKSAQEEEDRRFDHALDRAERFMRRMMQLFRESDGKTPPNPL